MLVKSFLFNYIIQLVKTTLFMAIRKELTFLY